MAKDKNGVEIVKGATAYISGKVTAVSDKGGVNVAIETGTGTRIQASNLDIVVDPNPNTPAANETVPATEVAKKGK